MCDQGKNLIKMFFFSFLFYFKVQLIMATISLHQINVLFSTYNSLDF